MEDHWENRQNDLEILIQENCILSIGVMRSCKFKNIDDDMKEDGNRLSPLFPVEKISAKDMPRVNWYIVDDKSIENRTMSVILMSMEWLQRPYPLILTSMLSYQVAPRIIEDSNPVDVIMINDDKHMNPRIVKKVDPISSNYTCVHERHNFFTNGADLLKRKRLEKECFIVTKLQESTSHGSPCIHSTSNSHPKISPEWSPSCSSIEVVYCTISSPSHSLPLSHNLDKEEICSTFTEWKYELQCLGSQFINMGIKCYENVMDIANDGVDVDEKLEKSYWFVHTKFQFLEHGQDPPMSNYKIWVFYIAKRFY